MVQWQPLVPRSGRDRSRSRRGESQRRRSRSRDAGHDRSDSLTAVAVEEELNRFGDRLDAKARQALFDIPVHKALSILGEIDEKRAKIKNPSAFVTSAVRNFTVGQACRESTGSSRGVTLAARPSAAPVPSAAPAAAVAADRDRASPRAGNPSSPNSQHEKMLEIETDLNRLKGTFQLNKDAREALDSIPLTDVRAAILSDCIPIFRSSSEGSKSQRSSDFVIDRVNAYFDGPQPSGHEPKGHEPSDHEPKGHEFKGHEHKGDESKGHEPKCSPPRYLVEDKVCQTPGSTGHGTTRTTATLKAASEYEGSVTARAHHRGEPNQLEEAEPSWSSEFYCFGRLDDKAKRSLADISEKAAHRLLQECEAKGDQVRNPSAFVMSNVKLIAQQEQEQSEWAEHDGSEHDHTWSRADSSRWREEVQESAEWESGENWKDSQDYNSQRQNSKRNSSATEAVHEQPEEEDEQKVWELLNRCSKIDDRAKELLSEVDPADALRILEKIDTSTHLVNPSAYVMKTCTLKLQQGRARPVEVNSIPLGKRRRADDGEHGSMQQTHDELEDRRDAPGAHSSRASRSESENLRDQRMHDDHAHKARAVFEDRHSPAVHNESMSAAKDTFGTSAAKDTFGTRAYAEVHDADWRLMDLRMWLRSVDNGKGFLMQYEEHLLKNFDTLEQIMFLYVPAPGPDNKLRIQEDFFEDLGVQKLAHRRLMEKWFRDRLQATD